MEEKILKATHRGELTIGDIKISCAILEDGRRVLSETGITNALLGTRSGASIKLKKAYKEAGSLLPIFVASNNLQPFIDDSLRHGSLTPIEYKDGRKIIYGYEASILPLVCDIWLKAREAGVLNQQQYDKAQKAEILMRGLAHIGIIALIDEATGYQEERDRNELQKILAAYISAELLPWTKRFPDEFYKQLFRLNGWQYSPLTVKRPQVVGKITNDIVYRRLPNGVLEELQSRNPPDSKGHRRYRHHQFLTEDIGNPHLEKHLTAVIALMKASNTWKGFKMLLDKAYPPGEGQLNLDFTYDDEEIN